VDLKAEGQLLDAVEALQEALGVCPLDREAMFGSMQSLIAYRKSRVQRLRDRGKVLVQAENLLGNIDLTLAVLGHA